MSLIWQGEYVLETKSAGRLARDLSATFWVLRKKQGDFIEKSRCDQALFTWLHDWNSVDGSVNGGKRSQMCQTAHLPRALKEVEPSMKSVAWGQYLLAVWIVPLYPICVTLWHQVCILSDLSERVSEVFNYLWIRNSEKTQLFIRHSRYSKPTRLKDQVSQNKSLFAMQICSLSN